MKIRSLYVLSLLLLVTVVSCQKPRSERWTAEEAQAWSDETGWLRGCNYQPRTAVNQLEMWQAETFDPTTIDEELGWASDIGFNVMRVYLHHFAWKQDPKGFKKRMDKYLTIADSHGISTLFVFFDDCWRDSCWVGKQPKPIAHRHNSGWVQDPPRYLRADTTSLYPVLEDYMKDVMKTFRKDKRIIGWDLYNEPGNSGYRENSFPLLKNAMKWGREANPAQPLTVGVWSRVFRNMNKFQLTESDVNSYHNYSILNNHINAIDTLLKYERPLICTEYMARTAGSTFDEIMPMLKERGVDAINWGFVSGKTNTIYPWSSADSVFVEEPHLWFHDVLRADGTPYIQAEVDLIKELTGK